MFGSRIGLFLGVSVLSACTTLAPPQAAELAAKRFSVVDGSAEALGMLAFVNDVGTTKVLLDVTVALDARAASGIVAHRDGPDARFGTPDDNKFDTIAELDAVYYVGDSALTAILNYAVANGWVAQNPGDLLGTWDGVSFTVAEAQAVLGQANSASYVALDVDAALDKRAVDAIFAARPVANIPQLAGLSYVGTSALTKLKAYAASQSGDVWTTAALQQAFADVTAGVWFPSESDFPLTAVFVVDAFPVTAAEIKTVLAPIYVQRPYESGLAERAVEVESVTDALGFLVTPADWWSEYETERAVEWAAILDVISHLQDPVVFRLGDVHGNNLGGAIDVYVLGGSAEGDLVGFHTVSVET